MNGEGAMVLALAVPLVIVLVVALRRQMNTFDAYPGAHRCKKCRKFPVRHYARARDCGDWHTVFFACPEGWFRGPCSAGRRVVVIGNAREAEAAALKYWNEGDHEW
jgi:hypothetical protein